VTVSVMVFTRDLRLGDNPALAAAARAAAMVPLFVLDETILGGTGGHANRLGFLLDSLHDLDTSLRARGGSLVVRAGPWVETVLQTAQRAGACRIHIAEDVSGYAAARLKRLERAAAGTRMVRQLAQEGFMHNRARMIAASFLTNDLRVDWRAGAAHFMRHLTDADVACNQLNWQWAAGTGTDTNPHRIFNPTRQGRRFDPTGAYVRRHVPELAGLPAAVIHDPDPATRRARGYPGPIVDHRLAIGAYRARRN
jgi:deoxyribodipyrimidine photolyase